VLGGIMLLWLLVSVVGGQLSPGGAVLGLLLAALLGLPLSAAGVFMLSRSGREAAEAEALRAQHRTLEADRLFRADLARELRQGEARLRQLTGQGVAQLADRVRDAATSLERPAYDQAAWYQAVELKGIDLPQLQRYDDLLRGGVGALGLQIDRLERDDAALPAARRAFLDFERNLQARTELLLGRRGPEIAPGGLLDAVPVGEARAPFASLRVGDAVSKDDDDYLVETSVSYFSRGETHWLHRLRAERGEVWLYVAPGALSLGWLQPVASPDLPAATSLDRGGVSFTLEDTTLADADVLSSEGQSGGSVTVWRYRAGEDRMLWVEQWESGPRAYEGPLIRPSDLDVWAAGPPGAA
jgi:hypothetical protein